MSKKNRVEIWLNKALELEYRGHDFYIDAAAKASDAKARDFFKFLAAQEKVHVDIIKKIHASLGSETCWSEAGEVDQSGPSLNEIFLKMSKVTPEADSDLIRAIDGGIVFETEAHAYYEREIPRASCAAEKKFLTILAAEENQHRQALADLKLYYTDPETWAEQMDHGTLDGV